MIVKGNDDDYLSFWSLVLFRQGICRHPIICLYDFFFLFEGRKASAPFRARRRTARKCYFVLILRRESQFAINIYKEPLYGNPLVELK
jgi:hypothetical protein